MMDTIKQNEINRVEWENPDNWGGPKWMSVYFSKKDSRTWVPKKFFGRTLGWTQNLAHTSGICWFWGIIIGLYLFTVILFAAIHLHFK